MAGKTSKGPSVKRTSTRPAQTRAGAGSGTAGKSGAASGGGKGRGSAAAKGGKPPRKGRWWKILLGTFAAGVALVMGVLVAAYMTIQIPEPDDFAQAATTQIYYADGTLMGEFSEYDRKNVELATLPAYVGHAVVASEDRSFYENSGIDLKGMARALWNNLTGGATQGGSTITQQYVERYYLGTTTSYAGKFREAILALKINNEMEKDAVLESYLNTIYFGRGAYGIEVAALNYFGKPAAELSLSEAALLAGIIPSPSNWDPAKNPEKAEQRWSRVLDLMVADGWITQAERDLQFFPATIDYVPENTYAGTNGYILTMVRDELVNSAGISEAEIDTAGLDIYTTIQPAMQQAAIDAVGNLPDDRPENNRVGLVSMDPRTGALVAVYGGPDYLTQSRNAVTQDRAQGGSTFKPFTLIAALEQGASLDDTYLSYDDMEIEGYDFPVSNYDTRDRGSINLVQSTQDSVNTVYVQLNVEYGPERTVDVATRLGLPESTSGLESVPSNVLGSASPTPYDMVRAYGTIASGGIRHEPYIVDRVLDISGNTRYQASAQGERVVEADVIANATYAMQAVVERGTGKTASEIGRPAAGKTGSSNNYRSAWFAGFVPQLVTVVDMYQVGPNGEEEVLTGFGGQNIISGGTYPVQIWTDYMKVAVAGMPVEDFPAPVSVPARHTPAPPAPSVTEEPTEEPTVDPTEEPTVAPPAEEPTVAPPVETTPPVEPPPTTQPPATPNPSPTPTEPPGNAPSVPPGQAGSG